MNLKEVLRQRRRTHPRMCWQVCHQIASVLRDVHDRGYTMGTLDVASVSVVCSDEDMATTVCVTLTMKSIVGPHTFLFIVRSLLQTQN